MKTKVLMICLGNICRSPLAEAILKSKVDPRKIWVDYAGTSGCHVGDAPNPRSITVALKYGMDISSQQCRRFSTSDFVEFDLVYAMDQNNYLDIIRLAKNNSESAKVRLLLNKVDLGIREVPDPYYGDGDGFENVYKMIDAACGAIAKKLY